jgi:hypothetical protein
MARPDKKSPLMQAAAIAGVSLVLGILFERFLVEHQPGLSFPLYVIGLVTGIFGLAYYLGHRPSKATWWLTLPFLGFAGMVAVRASEPLTLLNLMACLLLLLLIAKTAFRRRLTDMRVGDYVRIPFLPLQFLEPAGRTLGEIIATHKTVKTRPVTAQIIKGVALTLPVLVIFMALFASADLVIQKYITGLINIQVDDELVARLILILLATLGLIGGYSYMFGGAKPEEAPAAAPSKSFIGPVENGILFGSVNILFLAFILIQLTYLFGGQANISTLGFTYAEYARKGFFELLAVAMVAFGVLWTAEKYVEKTDRGHSVLFKVLSVGLVLQVILIMASAFRRLYLYEEAYGFTTLRLYSHAFTLLLAVLFVILAYKIIRSASEQAFMFPAFLAIVGFLVALNALNPDAFIARQNLDRYRNTGKIDVEYLRELSADAVPVLVNGRSLLEPDDAAALERELNRRRLKSESDPHWQSWNLSRATADRQLVNE